MARQRSPDRNKAFEMWKESGGTIKLKDIAAALGLQDTQIRKWKNQDKWSEQLKSNVTNSKSNVTNEKEKPKRSVRVIKEPVHEDDEGEEILDLTEKQRLFCLYYVKSFNATQSAIKAGYSAETAHVQGPRLLGNVRVSEYIRELKGGLTDRLFLEAMDVLRKYVEIAFANITDYLTFGKKEEQVIGMYGPVFEGEGKNKKPVMQVVNYVDLNESSMVDGSLIAEVKQGKDGVGIKLHDKMKALDKLAQYFDLFPDKFKREIEAKKQELDRERFDFERKKFDGPEADAHDQNNGYEQALNAQAEDVFADEVLDDGQED